MEEIKDENEENEVDTKGLSPDSLVLRRELLQNIVRKLYQTTRSLTDKGLPHSVLLFHKQKKEE
jgi:hypothetical protein